MSLRGYWRTLSDRTAVSPAMRITRLTTSERTGRLTNMSVNFTVGSPPSSVVFRLGRGVVRRLDLVVDMDRGAVAELEGPGGHDLLARLEAGEDRDLVAPAAAELHELLSHALVARPLRVLKVAHHVDGVAVGRIADRGGGKGEDCRRRPEDDLRLHEHPRAQLAPRVGERRLDLDVAGSGIHDRVHGGDLSGGHDLLFALGGDANLAARLELGHLLLGHREVHVDGIERLQGHDGV